MPTPEQYAKYKELEDAGEIGKLPLKKQIKLKKLFGGDIKVDEFSVPNTGGIKKEVIRTYRGPDERREGLLYPDVKEKKYFNLFGPEIVSEGEAIDLSKPTESVRTFIPDERVFSGGSKGTPVRVRSEDIGPGQEFLQSFANEMKTAVARSTGIPSLLEVTGLEKDTTQKIGGLTPEEYEEDVSFAQKLLAGLPADMAIGAGMGQVGSAIARSPVGKEAIRGVKRALPSFSTAGRRALKIKGFRERQAQIATESLDDFVLKAGGEIDDDLAKAAMNEGFSVDGTADGLRKAIGISQASKEAGQKGLLRDIAMDEDDLRRLMGEKYGFIPAKENAKSVIGILEGDAVRKGVQETAEELALKSGSGTPKMFDTVIPNPMEMGGAPTKNKVFNLNLRQIPAKEEDIRGFIQQAAEANISKFEGARYLGDKTLTRQIAYEEANRLGLSLDELSLRNIGEAWNGVESRYLARQLSDNTKTLWETAKAVTDVNDEKQVVNFAKELTTHLAHMANFKGGLSESARALSLSKMVSSQEHLKEKAIKDLFKAIKTPDDWKKALEFIKGTPGDDVAAINGFVENLTKSTFEKVADGAYFAWINSLLSGPITQIRNALGNSVTALSGPIEKEAAAIVQLARSKVMPNVKRDRFVGEGLEYGIGVTNGLKQGSRAFLKALSTGQSQFGFDRYAIPKANPIPGKVGKVIGTPGRMLVAFDDFFKTINYTGSLYSGAYRQAAKEGLKGGQMATRMSELIKDPTAKMVKEGLDEAAYRTFTRDLGQQGKVLQLFINQTPGLKWVMPFVKTPVNIFKYGLERTPLGFAQLTGIGGKLKGGQVDDVVARAFGGTLALVGGTGAGIKALKDIQGGEINRPAHQPDAKEISVGSLLSGGLAQVYAEGGITGGAPTDPELRRVFYASGKKPYSIKIGNQWVQYNVEPFGVSIGAMMDGIAIMDKLEDEDAAYGIGIAMAKNFVNKSFMQGLSNLMDAYSDPERYLKRFATQFASGFIPFSSLMRTIGNVADPQLRRADDFKQTVQMIIPGMRDKLPPLYDIWGNEVFAEGTAVERALSPIRRSAEKTDKATQEVDRLGVKPGSVQRYTGKLELESPVYYAAQKLRGRYSKLIVDRLVNSKKWDTIPDSKKSDFLNKGFNRAGELTRKQLLISSTDRSIVKLISAIQIAKEKNDPENEQRLKEMLDTKLNQDILKKRYE